MYIKQRPLNAIYIQWKRKISMHNTATMPVTYFLIENDIANGFTIIFLANIYEELAKKIDDRD